MNIQEFMAGLSLLELHRVYDAVRKIDKGGQSKTCKEAYEAARKEMTKRGQIA